MSSSPSAWRRVSSSMRRATSGSTSRSGLSNAFCPMSGAHIARPECPQEGAAPQGGYDAGRALGKSVVALGARRDAHPVRGCSRARPERATLLPGHAALRLPLQAFHRRAAQRWPLAVLGPLDRVRHLRAGADHSRSPPPADPALPGAAVRARLQAQPSPGNSPCLGGALSAGAQDWLLGVGSSCRRLRLCSLRISIFGGRLEPALRPRRGDDASHAARVPSLCRAAPALAVALGGICARALLLWGRAADDAALRRHRRGVARRYVAAPA